MDTRDSHIAVASAGERRPTRMHRLGWLVVGLALIEGGWLAFDGIHALTTGDYVTASSGDYAGQLGPWSTLVAAAGIPPRSIGMKVAHLVIGIAWFFAIGLFAGRHRMGRTSMLLCSIAGAWYLPFGTIIGAIIFILLFTRPLRASA
ncbi:MAG: hypothetical protein H6818_09275 [Phycisphaerales bacterium]|nr:hypothetical protein [Phycisphaerales bacterium]MCB9864892.1 hypothetical protein [Phycisphaerales bacterium]